MGARKAGEAYGHLVGHRGADEDDEDGDDPPNANVPQAAGPADAPGAAPKAATRGPAWNGWAGYEAEGGTPT
eukprot:10814848-Alexandrium_andersonii.AAC.1